MRLLRLVSALTLVVCAACDASNPGRTGHPPDLAGGTDDFGSGGGDDFGGLSDGGIFQPQDGDVIVQDPTTCAEAAMNKTYIGCDYWPTVVANPVWSIFDYAVVVSNPGTNPAM